MESKIEEIGEGLDVANKLAMENGATVDELKQSSVEDSAKIQEVKKNADKVDRKASSSLKLVTEASTEYPVRKGGIENYK